MKRLAILLVLGFAVPETAQADTIRLLTGVDGANAVLASGALDPAWTISVQGGAFAAAEVAGPLHPNLCCGMETVGAQARWISDQSIWLSDASTGWGIGQTAVAQRTFDLTDFDLSTVALSGLWRVADTRLGVYLNGVLLDGTRTLAFGFGEDQAFSAGSSFFVAGLNTIELRGSSVNSVWDGFWLDATVEGRRTSEPVPDAGSTLLLLGMGIAGLRAWKNRLS